MSAPTTNPTTESVIDGRQGAQWPLVARREITVRLKDRNFLISTGVTLVMLVGIFVVQSLLAGNGTQYNVAVTDQAASGIVTQAAEVVSADSDDTLTSTDVADRAAGEEAVRDGDVDALLIAGDQGWELVADGTADSGLMAALDAAVTAEVLTERADSLGVSVDELVAGTQLLPVDIGDGDGATSVMTFLLAVAFAVLFYFAAIMFGMAIANSVVEEKQSRIVEILAAVIPVRQLLTGKVLGNTALALLQLLLIVAVSLIGLAFTDFDIDLGSVAGPIIWYIPFFLAGFLALACIWAAAGALASRSEDLQSTTMPVTMALVIILFAGLGVSGTAEIVASYIPVVSTIAMPSRLLMEDVMWFEPVISLLLTLAFAALTVAAGGRLYQRSLLQTQGRLSMRQAWSLKA